MNQIDKQLNDTLVISDHEYFTFESPENLLDYKLKHPYNMSPSTRTNYSAKWSELISKRHEVFFSLQVEGLVKWVIGEYKSGNHKASTFRVYRAVCYFGLSTLINEDGCLEKQFEEIGLNEVFFNDLYKKLKNFKLSKKDESEEKVSTDINTSSKKKKSFPQPVLEWLLNVDSKNMKIVALLQMFLKANLLIGLRPSEWLNVREAQSITGMTVLVVDNAKNSQGRANGSTRTLILKDINLEEKKAIREFKREFHAFLESEFEKFKFKCEAYYANDPKDKSGKRALGQQRLNLHYGEGLSWNPIFPQIPMEELVMINQDYSHILQPEFARIQLIKLQSALARLLDECPLLDRNDPIRPTLYSTRHQCIADAKQSKMDVFEMAAFFGHASIKTAREHY